MEENVKETVVQDWDENEPDHPLVDIEVYDEELICPRCSKGYKGRCLDVKYKQVRGCASSIRIQKVHSELELLFRVIDGPPRNKIITVGEAYLQTFYGSRNDGSHYMFTAGDRTLPGLQEMYPWVSRDACICDNCIEELEEMGVLSYAGES